MNARALTACLPWLVAVTCAVACARASEEPAAFELRPVVAPTLARLAAGAPAPEPAAEPAAEPDDAAREGFESVIGPLRSGDAGLRELVIEDARRLSPAGVALLARALCDPSETERARLGLTEVLGALATPAAIDALGSALTGAFEPAVRAQCAYRLGLAGQDIAVPRLLQRLKYEKDYETVYWIADALARLGNLSGIEGLLELWSRSEGDELRERAAARLNELAREHELADVETLRARWLDGTLPARVSPSPALLLETWRWIERLGEWNLRFVDDARFVLVGMEPWVVPLLCEALHEEEVYVRLHAAQCLERRGKRAAGAAAELEAALREPRIAAVAASALGTLGAESAAPALERAAASPSRDPDLRTAATRALGALGLPRSIPVLEELFATAGSADLRQAAAQSLIAIDGAHSAIAFVQACLLDEQADAGEAERALGAWLAARAASDPAAATARERWESLAGDPQRIPTAAEVAERRRARADVLRELGAAVTPRQE